MTLASTCLRHDLPLRVLVGLGDIGDVGRFSKISLKSMQSLHEFRLWSSADSIVLSGCPSLDYYNSYLEKSVFDAWCGSSDSTLFDRIGITGDVTMRDSEGKVKLSSCNQMTELEIQGEIIPTSLIVSDCMALCTIVINTEEGGEDNEVHEFVARDMPELTSVTVESDEINLHWGHVELSNLPKLESIRWLDVKLSGEFRLGWLPRLTSLVLDANVSLTDAKDIGVVACLDLGQCVSLQSVWVSAPFVELAAAGLRQLSSLAISSAVLHTANVSGCSSLAQACLECPLLAEYTHDADLITTSSMPPLPSCDESMDDDDGHCEKTQLKLTNLWQTTGAAAEATSSDVCATPHAQSASEASDTDTPTTIPPMSIASSWARVKRVLGISC